FFFNPLLYKMEIILTVPHSSCLNEPERTCDLIALKAANHLKNALESNATVHLFKADKNRYTIDYNRFQGRFTPWRSQIRKNLKDASLLLDIHSFPNESDSFGLLNGDIPEIVILDSYLAHNKFIDATTSTNLRNYLSSKGIAVKLLRG